MLMLAYPYPSGVNLFFPTRWWPGWSKLKPSSDTLALYPEMPTALIHLRQQKEVLLHRSQGVRALWSAWWIELSSPVPKILLLTHFFACCQQTIVGSQMHAKLFEQDLYTHKNTKCHCSCAMGITIWDLLSAAGVVCLKRTECIAREIMKLD